MVAKKRARSGVYYHFTSTTHLALIRAEGRILTTESNVGSGSPHLRPYGVNVGPRVVWLLDTPELGHAHGLTGSNVDKTVIRMTVEVQAWRWLDWPHRARMNPEWQAGVVRAAGGWAAARRWWVCEQPIPSANWLAVEKV